MFRIKICNKISDTGLGLLDPALYEIGEDIESPDAILVRSANLHEMEFPKSLKCIVRAGAGVNNIPVPQATEQGIVVFNTPGANANAVKELVLCALFLSSRKIVDGINWVSGQKDYAGDFSKLVEKEKNRFSGPEIEGKKFGVIGLGAIGVMVANAAHGLGMEVYGYDPYISVRSAWGMSRGVKRAASIKAILDECDYVSLHVPLNDETRGMIREETLKTAKNGIRILNFSRGGLVSTADMIKALHSGAVSSYVTDFPSIDLIGVPGVTQIPHLGASTPESEENCARMAAMQLMNFLEHGNIKNAVNLPHVEAEREGAHRLCVINKNIPNIVGQISSLLAESGINIENMANRSKQDYAYTVVDTNMEMGDALIEKIRSAAGVVSAWVLD